MAPYFPMNDIRVNCGSSMFVRLSELSNVSKSVLRLIKVHKLLGHEVISRAHQSYNLLLR